MWAILGVYNIIFRVRLCFLSIHHPAYGIQQTHPAKTEVTMFTRVWHQASGIQDPADWVPVLFLSHAKITIAGKLLVMKGKLFECNVLPL